MVDQGPACPALHLAMRGQIGGGEDAEELRAHHGIEGCAPTRAKCGGGHGGHMVSVGLGERGGGQVSRAMAARAGFN